MRLEVLGVAAGELFGASGLGFCFAWGGVSFVFGRGVGGGVGLNMRGWGRGERTFLDCFSFLSFALGLRRVYRFFFRHCGGAFVCIPQSFIYTPSRFRI